MTSSAKELESLIKLGSKTAKGGFDNEHDVIYRFNNWAVDEIASDWLKEMGHEPNDVQSVVATKVKGSYKADIQVKVVTNYSENLHNIQVKLVSNPQGFNQVDKRWVDKYIELWGIPPTTANILKLFSGEKQPNLANTRDPRRTFFDEMDTHDQQIIVKFCTDHKSLIISDIFKGRGEYSAAWTLVIVKLPNEYRWTLRPISEVIDLYSEGRVYITPKGSLKIGQVGMQRKGGDGGRPTSNMLQFKINPVLLFKN